MAREMLKSHYAPPAARLAGRPTDRQTGRGIVSSAVCACARLPTLKSVCVAECGALRRFKSMSRDVRWAVA
jgi:hypothetical protein